MRMQLQHLEVLWGMIAQYLEVLWLWRVCCTREQRLPLR
jgi:hypothetical protein